MEKKILEWAVDRFEGPFPIILYSTCEDFVVIVILLK